MFATIYWAATQWTGIASNWTDCEQTRRCVIFPPLMTINLWRFLVFNMVILLFDSDTLINLEGVQMKSGAWGQQTDSHVEF